MKLGKLLHHAVVPPVILPSFAQASSPDHVIHVAGLRITAHSQGTPYNVINYFTVGFGSRGHSAPVSPVPEVSTALMLAIGLAAVAIRARGESKAEGRQA